MKDDRSPRVKYDHLYTVWSKFKNRSSKDQEILKAAGKANVNMLDGCGNATDTVCYTEFMPEIRYCLKNTYKIPEEPKCGRFMYARYYYQCPECLRHHECDIDPEDVESSNEKVYEHCSSCDTVFELTYEQENSYENVFD